MNISGPVLLKLIEYLQYKDRYSSETCTVPDFSVESEFAFDLAQAANYLGIE